MSSLVHESSSLTEVKEAIKIAKSKKKPREVMKLLKLQKKINKRMKEQKLSGINEEDDKNKSTIGPFCLVCSQPIFPQTEETKTTVQSNTVTSTTKATPILKCKSTYENEASLQDDVKIWCAQYKSQNPNLFNDIIYTVDTTQKLITVILSPKDQLPIELIVNYNNTMLSASSTTSLLENDPYSFTDKMTMYCFSSNQSKKVDELLSYAMNKIVIHFINDQNKDIDGINDSNNSDNSGSSGNSGGSDSDSDSDSDSEFEYVEDEHDLAMIEEETIKAAGETKEKKMTGFSSKNMLRQVSYDSGDHLFIQNKRETLINRLEVTTNLSKSSNTLLLKHSGWNLEKAKMKWNTNPITFQKEAGISLNSSKKGYDLGCGHEFCTQCWYEYLSQAIYTIPVSNALDTRCMFAKCNIVVDENTFRRFLSSPPTKTSEGTSQDMSTIDAIVQRNLQQLDKIIVDSFVGEQNAVKWCPVPDCGMAILFSKRQSTVSLLFYFKLPK